MSFGLGKYRKPTWVFGLLLCVLLPVGLLLEARLQGDSSSGLRKHILGAFGKQVMNGKGKKGPSLSIVDISRDGKKGHRLSIPSLHPLVIPSFQLESDYYTESLLIRFEVNGIPTFKGRIPKAFSRPRPLPLNLRRSWTP